MDKIKGRLSNARLYQDFGVISEHFGFLPIRFLDELYDFCYLVVYNALAGFQNYVKSISTIDSYAIDEAFLNLAYHTESSFDRSFNTFTQYFFDHILRIPEDTNIVLEHYKDLDLDCTDEAEALLDQELEAVQKSILAQKAFQHLLTSEIVNLDRQLENVQEYKDSLEFLSSIPHQEKVYPVDDTARLVTEQVDQLSQTAADVIDRVTHPDVLKHIATPDERVQHLLSSTQEQLNIFREKFKSST